MKCLHLLAIAMLLPAYGFAEKASESSPIAARARVIIDNDFGGDPDGLYQLAHHLLSPSVEVRGVIASGHYASGLYDQPGSVEFSLEKAEALLDLMKLKNQVTLLGGVPARAEDNSQKALKAARFVVQEAMRDDVATPLYFAAGAGLTTLAHAYRLEPKIAERVTLIWIGGPEHQDIALSPSANDQMEYNLGIDLPAAQFVFNESTISIWQVPRDAYRQTLVSHTELKHRLDQRRTRPLFNRADREFNAQGRPAVRRSLRYGR